MNLKIIKRICIISVFLLCFLSVFSQSQNCYSLLKNAQDCFEKGLALQSESLFESLYNQADLPDEIKIECAKYFLKTGQYEKSFLLSDVNNKEEAVYIKALSLTGIGKEKEALQIFAKLVNGKYAGF
jgi:hypothetical protein